MIESFWNIVEKLMNIVIVYTMPYSYTQNKFIQSNWNSTGQREMNSVATNHPSNHTVRFQS